MQGNSPGPSAPVITFPDMLRQFGRDVFGKEVQDATTYSYTWLADQVGHVCLGLLLNFAVSAIRKYLVVGLQIIGQSWITDWAPALIAIVITSGWEFLAYRNSARKATGPFPLGKKLLRNNAIIASYYMALGAILGYFVVEGAVVVVGDGVPWRQIVWSLVLIALGAVAVPYWLKQKIIWQKAALPYLFRLAEAKDTFNQTDPRDLQELIDDKVPPKRPGRQVVIGGPIGSGRTALAAGVGTEFAFKGAKVRYLSFDGLLEFAVGPTPDDLGPWNIEYWPWNEAQIVVIDNIGPLIAARGRQQKSKLLTAFKACLADELRSVAPVFNQCHSVWVLGDLSGTTDDDSMTGKNLDDLAAMIRDYCGSKGDALVVELQGSAPGSGQSGVPTRSIAPGAKVRRLPYEDKADPVVA
jgi:hypothetical protein